MSERLHSHIPSDCKANFYCPTGQILLPNWEILTAQLESFYCPTRESLLPHLKVFVPTSESFCRQTWEKVLPDLGVFVNTPKGFLLVLQLFNMLLSRILNFFSILFGQFKNNLHLCIVILLQRPAWVSREVNFRMVTSA